MASPDVAGVEITVIIDSSGRVDATVVPVDELRHPSSWFEGECARDNKNQLGSSGKNWSLEDWRNTNLRIAV